MRGYILCDSFELESGARSRWRDAKPDCASRQNMGMNFVHQLMRHRTRLAGCRIFSAPVSWMSRGGARRVQVLCLATIDAGVSAVLCRRGGEAPGSHILGNRATGLQPDEEKFRYRKIDLWFVLDISASLSGIHWKQMIVILHSS